MRQATQSSQASLTVNARENGKARPSHPRWISPAQLRDRSLGQFPQHVTVDVVERLYVQTTHGGLVFSELCHEGLGLEIGRHVQRQLVFARREADERRVTLPPARIDVVIGIEAHDARAPHLRRLAGELLEQLHQLLAVFQLLAGGRLLQESGDTDLGRLGLVFSHNNTPAIQTLALRETQASFLQRRAQFRHRVRAHAVQLKHLGLTLLRQFHQRRKARTFERASRWRGEPGEKASFGLLAGVL